MTGIVALCPGFAAPAACLIIPTTRSAQAPGT